MSISLSPGSLRETQESWWSMTSPIRPSAAASPADGSCLVTADATVLESSLDRLPIKIVAIGDNGRQRRAKRLA